MNVASNHTANIKHFKWNPECTTKQFFYSLRFSVIFMVNIHASWCHSRDMLMNSRILHHAILTYTVSVSSSRLCVKIRGMRRFIFSCIWLIWQEIERRRSLNTWGTSIGCENEPVKYGNMSICTAGEWIITASTAPQKISSTYFRGSWWMYKNYIVDHV